MKKIDRLRFFNRYVFTSILLLLIALLVSWFYVSDLFYWYFLADFENDADLVGQNKKEAVSIMVAQIMNWEIYIQSAMTYTLYLLPLFSVLPVVQFFNERKGYLKWATVRMKSYRRYLYTTVLKYAVISGICTSLPFIVFFTLGNLFLIDNLDDIGNFGKFLGENFYANHPYVFFLFMSCTIYFAIGFTLGLMGCAITLWFDKKYLLVTIPIIYYLVIGNIAEAFNLPLLNIIHSVIAYNTLFSTGEIFVPLLLPLLISIGAIFYHERRRANFDL